MSDSVREGDATTRLASLIRHRLAEMGKTVVWLSENSGVARSTIYRVLREGTSPRLDHAEAIAQALGLEPVEIFEATGDGLHRLHRAIREGDASVAHDALADLLGVPVYANPGGLDALRSAIEGDDPGAIRRALEGLLSPATFEAVTGAPPLDRDRLIEAVRQATEGLTALARLAGDDKS